MEHEHHETGYKEFMKKFTRPGYEGICLLLFIAVILMSLGM